MIISSSMENLRTNTDVFEFAIGDADMVSMDSWNEESQGAVSKC